MSLQKKIEQEMDDLALVIIRRVAHQSENPTLKKMAVGWLDLRRLLGMANSVVEIDKNVSKDRGAYDPDEHP